MSDISFRQAIINLDAIRANMRHLLDDSGVDGMAIVKANGYGHGAIQVARAVLEAGAHWLGVADLGEARQLRSAGITAPILAWLHGPGSDFAAAIVDDIDIGVSDPGHLELIARAARLARRRARVHIKVDTGLSRNGIGESDWALVARDAARYERDGVIDVRGLFSHLSNASPADDALANEAFARAKLIMGDAGVKPGIVHLAATAGALRFPAARHTLARFGIGVYGLSPFAASEPVPSALTPAMTLVGRVVSVKRIRAGAGVSYDYTYRAPRDTTVALVPLGYADGIPRAASGSGEVQLRGRRYPVRGRIAMDQCVVEVGDDPVEVGDRVVVFGDPVTGAPSASDWGTWAGTINYDIVTGIGNRVIRTYEH